MKKELKITLVFVLIILWIFLLNNNIINNNIINNNNLKKSNDFSKFYSSQCSEWEIMSSRYIYNNWSIKVNKCTIPYECPEWKKLESYCADLIDYKSCGLICFWSYDDVPEWS